MTPAPLPPDDLTRPLVLTDVDSPSATHLGLAGDTYTILITGQHTAGKYCLIDMHIPPGGGPPPHRHDFEESFTIQEGEITVTFRGHSQKLTQGQTATIPANAPHQFKNEASTPARLLCICAPAGQEEYFAEVAVKVPARTTPPPQPTPDQAAAAQAKAKQLAPKYRTEFL